MRVYENLEDQEKQQGTFFIGQPSKIEGMTVYETLEAAEQLTTKEQTDVDN